MEDENYNWCHRNRKKMVRGHDKQLYNRLDNLEEMDTFLVSHKLTVSDE